MGLFDGYCSVTRTHILEGAPVLGFAPISGRDETLRDLRDAQRAKCEENPVWIGEDDYDMYGSFDNASHELPEGTGTDVHLVHLSVAEELAGKFDGSIAWTIRFLEACDAGGVDPFHSVLGSQFVELEDLLAQSKIATATLKLVGHQLSGLD